MDKSTGKKDTTKHKRKLINWNWMGIACIPAAIAIFLLGGNRPGCSRQRYELFNPCQETALTVALAVLGFGAFASVMAYKRNKPLKWAAAITLLLNGLPVLIAIALTFFVLVNYYFHS